METFKNIFSLKGEPRWVKITVLAILIIFCGVCIWTSLHYGNKLLLGSLKDFDNDDVKYLRSANTLIETGKFTYSSIDQSTVFIMPGLVFLLVPFVKIFGMTGAITGFRIFQAILQTGTMYLLFLIARRIINSKFAILSTVLIMLYIPNIYTTSLILTEVPFVFMFFLLILLIIHAVEAKKTSLYIASGICWGLCAFFRPPIAAFPIVILILWIFKKYKIKEIIKFSLIAAACFAIVLSPWWIRNYITFNKFIPFTMATGNPALQGAFINYEQDYSNIDVSDIDYGETEMSANSAEKTLSERVVAYNLRVNPGRYIVWMTLGKTVMNFRAPFLWYTIYGISFRKEMIIHLFILGLGIIGGGIAAFRRKFNGYGWLLLGSVLYFNCIYLPFYCFPRYVYPVMSIVLIGMAYLIWVIMLGLKKVLTPYFK